MPHRLGRSRRGSPLRAGCSDRGSATMGGVVDHATSNQVLRPPPIMLAMTGGVAAVFTAAAVIAGLGLRGGTSTGGVAAVAAVGVVAVICLLGLAMTLTTRVWVEDTHLYVTTLFRTTRRSLAAPASVRLRYSRNRNDLRPPWWLTFSESGMADLSVGFYQVGPPGPLLQLVAPAVRANPGLPADELTAAALRDPSNPP